MPRRIILALAVLSILASLGTLQGQQDRSPWFGTWKVNLAKSTFPAPPPFKRATCRIEPLGDSWKVSYDLVGTRGGVQHFEWTGKLDGIDRSLQGVEAVLTHAYVWIDDKTYQVIAKADGELVSTTKTVISPDGKTLTAVTNSKNTPATILVYDKQ